MFMRMYVYVMYLHGNWTLDMAQTRLKDRLSTLPMREKSVRGHCPRHSCLRIL